MNQNDVSPLIFRENQVLERDEKFNTFIEAAPDAIVVVDKKGRIILVNHLAEEMFGYERKDLIGQYVEILVPARYQTSHVKDRDKYFKSPRTRPMGEGRELTGLRKDGTEFPVEISLSPLKTEIGIVITSIIRDITERRKAQEQIKASLREKEALLKEIHHRVKNNLQVTSSLLRLQSSFLEDPKSKEMFIESQNRIRSMALVHEKLYQSRNLSQINLGDYIETLATLLFRSFAVDPQKVQLKVSASDVFLSIETAVPCGLMINELLSNCLKHAFPQGEGKILVQVTSEGDSHYTLKISDNGIGLPPHFDPKNTGTLGLRLLQTLTDQLNGTIDIKSSAEGTEFKIYFTETRSPTHGA